MSLSVKGKRRDKSMLKRAKAYIKWDSGEKTLRRLVRHIKRNQQRRDRLVSRKLEREAE